MTWVQVMDIDPLTPWALTLFSLGAVLGFSSRRSLIRPAVLPLMAFSAYLVVITSQTRQKLHTSLYLNLLGSTACSLLFEYIDSALLRGLEAPDRENGKEGSGTANSDMKPALRRLQFGLGKPFNGRASGTPEEVKNVPLFCPLEPGKLPTRTEFLCGNAARCIAYFALLDIAGIAGEPDKKAIHFASEKIPFLTRISDVTIEDLVVRLISGITTWVLSYALLQALYSGTAFTTVAFGISKLESWRPLFGSLADCWSIRQFWG